METQEDQSHVEDDKVDVKIINLSKKILDKYEISLLEHGLKFCPNPKQADGKNDLLCELKEFHKKLVMKEFFHNKNSSDGSLVKNPSNFTINENNESITQFIKSAEVQIQNLDHTKTSSSHNLSRNEQKALSRLTDDNKILIQKADKGNAIIVMDCEYYEKLCYDVLHDTFYYEKLSNNPKIHIEYNRLIKSFKKILSVKEYDYLMKFDCKDSYFYGLPKVHKSQLIKNACIKNNCSYIRVQSPEDLKIRPIISSKFCQSNRLSELVDILLKPFMECIPSYVKDTKDFLNKLPRTCGENSIMATFDIVSLYSNINKDLGTKAIIYWVEKHPEKLHERFNIDIVIQSIHYILENNIFVFNDEYYRQKWGTAMGTKCAPTYACLTVAYLENSLYDRLLVIFDDNLQLYVFENWKRFIDDCIIIWPFGMEKLMLFNHELNNLDENIAFTMEHSDVEISFLDVMIRKDNRDIQTDIFYKETDTKQYLRFDSCHPKSTRINIPFTLARRICLIVSEESQRHVRLQQLQQYLKRLKYPNSVIQTGIEKAKELKREDLLLNSEKNQKKIIPYISKYNPNNPNVFSILKKNLPILETDSRMQNVLRDYTIVNCRRQSKSLGATLTTYKYSKSVAKHLVEKCQSPKCGTCDILMEGSQFSFLNGKMILIQRDMKCDSKYVIYVIKCNNCNLEYIGETECLRNRVRVHKQQILDANLCFLNVSKHIRSCAKNVNPMFKIMPIFKFADNNRLKRRLKETEMISIYQPALNR